MCEPTPKGSRRGAAASRKGLAAWAVVLGLLLAPVSGAWAKKASKSPLQQLAAGLVGAWKGKIRHTPSGDLPYAIAFRLGGGRLAGVTSIDGSARHYWSFRMHEKKLQLRFRSTFVNPRRVFVLELQKKHKKRWFFGRSKAFQLRLELCSAKRVVVRILRHGKRHGVITWSK